MIIFVMLTISTSVGIVHALAPDCTQWALNHFAPKTKTKTQTKISNSKKVHTPETLAKWKAWNIEQKKRLLRQLQLTCGDEKLVALDESPVNLPLIQLADDPMIAIGDLTSDDSFSDSSPDSSPSTQAMDNSDDNNSENSVAASSGYNFPYSNNFSPSSVTTPPPPNISIAETPEPSGYILILTGIFFLGILVYKV